MRKLFPHQIEGVEWLKSVGRGILADEMGLGKSLTTIMASIETPGALVVCPASLKKNWEREIRMTGETEIQVINSGDILDGSKWTIVNYDILDRYIEDFREDFGTGKRKELILDEAHYIKDPAANRSKAALSIAEEAAKVYALSGSPVLNRPIELFSLLRAVKHPLAWRYDEEKKKPVSITTLKRKFSERYCNGHMRIIYLRSGRVLRFWDESGANRIEELKVLTKRVMLRRTKKEVLDLPEKIVSVVSDTLSKEWQTRYDDAWDEYLEYIQNNPLKKDQIAGILTAQGLVELIKLRQVCSLAKLERIAEEIENAIDQEQKVIVFTSFTETVKTLKAMLAKKKIHTVSLTGSDNSEARDKAVQDFQEGDAKVFVANIKAGGVGLNLTAASAVMFADFDWSPAVNQQAEDRAHRIGQTGTVNVYYYVLEGTIEEDMIDALQAKQESIGALTGGERTNLAFAELLLRRAGLGTTYAQSAYM